MIAKSPRRPADRRGTLYIAVLGVTMIVGMIALAASTAGRLELRRAVSDADQREARLLAQSAVEYGLNWVANTGNDWRNTLSSGVESTSRSLGNGSFRWTIIDENAGDLTTANSVTLRGIGQAGEAVAVEEVALEATGEGLSSMDSAMHSNSTWTATDATIGSDYTLSSNDDIVIENTNVDTALLWCVDRLTQTTRTNTGYSSSGQDLNSGSPRAMPDESVFDYYTSRGTWIDASTILALSGVRTISGKLFTPSSNPFGEPNGEGIYVIDCGGDNVQIEDSRVLGTLVLINPGSESGVSGAITWDPAAENYPSLLVNGDVQFDMTSSGDNQTVTETAAGQNLNPDGAPYAGNTDNDTDDVYPGGIRGLVYVSGNASIVDVSTFEGVLVAGGAISIEADVSFTYDETFFSDPPPGFSGGDALRLVPSTWRRAAR